MEVSHILPAVLDESALWKYIFDIADAVVGRPLANRVEALARRRDLDSMLPAPRDRIDTPSAANDPDIANQIKRLALQMGYHYANLNTDVDSLARFASEAVRFAPVSGTTLCFNFIQYLINGYIELDQLWYDPLWETLVPVTHNRIQGRRIVLDGETANHDCYPTTYFNLRVQQGLGLSDDALLELMYSVIPENMVIWSIATTIIAPAIRSSANPMVVEMYVDGGIVQDTGGTGVPGPPDPNPM